MRRWLSFLLLFLSLSARAADIEAIHRVWAVSEDGMPGTREEWITSSLQRRERIAHAHDETVTVYDGTNGWRRDWNGFVERLAGSDLRRQRDMAVAHSFGIFSASDPDLHFMMDAATGLPSRAEMPSFDGVMTIAFSDWRTVDGVRVPFAETWTTGPNTTTAHLESIEFIPRGRVDLTPPAAGPNDAFFLHPGASSETIPFNFDNNHIMLLATVNGIGPIWFLVDTGAEFSLINQSRLGELGLTPYGALAAIGGGSSATSGSYVEHVTYRLGDVELRDQHAAVIELRGLDRLYGMQVGGLLGFDFLSRFVVDIDYGAKTLTLHPRDFDARHIPGAAVVPIVMQGEQPYLAGTIGVRGETIPAWFILDVGAADTITFTTPYVAAHHLLERAGDASRTVHKFAAPDVDAFNPTNVRGLIDAVTIGGITLPHVLVNFSAAKNGAYTSPAFDGNIGETLLSRFAHVILDYGRSVMILVPSPSTTKPFSERKTFGLNVVTGWPDLHHFLVTAVGDASPAATAGFRKGDVIEAVDATPATQLTLAMLKKVFSEEGSHHTIRVHRGADDVELAATIAMEPVSGLR